MLAHYSYKELVAILKFVLTAYTGTLFFYVKSILKHRNKLLVTAKREMSTWNFREINFFNNKCCKLISRNIFQSVKYRIMMLLFKQKFREINFLFVNQFHEIFSVVIFFNRAVWKSSRENNQVLSKRYVRWFHGIFETVIFTLQWFGNLGLYSRFCFQSLVYVYIVTFTFFIVWWNQVILRITFLCSITFDVVRLELFF